MAVNRVQRKMAAILAADVVGYSRLIGMDEEGTLATLKMYREVIDGLSQDFFGTIEALGRQDCDFFLGGAVDFDAKGCQLQLTPLFRTQSDARDAAVALGRPTFFVSQWRANQCGAMPLRHAERHSEWVKSSTSCRSSSQSAALAGTP